MIELTLAGPSAAAYAGPPGFSGSLDLLLAIVRRNGYPLDQLPLGEITRQFTVYVQQAQEQKTDQNLDLGAEFFETISWLVLLKSRALLPGQGTEAAPAEELRQALVAQEQIQAWSGWLGERLDRTGIAAGRHAAPPQDAEQEAVPAAATEASQSRNDPTAPAPTVHDALVSARRALAAARRALAAARRALAAARLHADAQAAAAAGVSTEEVLATLRRRLGKLTPGQALSTAAWFRSNTREAQSTLLLALLELARLDQLWVFQAAPGTPLWVQRPPQDQDRRPALQEKEGGKRAHRSTSAKDPQALAGAAP